MQRKALGILAALAVIGLIGCSGGSAPSTPSVPAEAPPPPPPVMIDLEVRLTNLTNNQPLSPLAVVAHDSSYVLFATGDTASDELEVLAEGGSPDDVLAAADNHAGVSATASGAGIIGPGVQETVALSIVERDFREANMSFATMLVNTNDGFAGIAGVDISHLRPGDSLSLWIRAYDAGTEANSEANGTIPGPAVGGEGYNEVRDELHDVIVVHRGVVGFDDGLVDSLLSSQERFDNPVAHVQIRRAD